MLDRSEKLREELEKLKKGDEEKKENCCISNFPNRKMYTPLHIAASRGSLKSMKVLLDFGIDVNILDNKDNTALHEACRTGHSASAELLIKRNVNIKIKNHIGATALHFACMKGMSEIAVLLIKNGANAYASTTLQTLAVDYADEELRATLIREYQLLIEDRIKLKKIIRNAVVIANNAAQAANKFARSASASNALNTAVSVARGAGNFAKELTETTIDNLLTELNTIRITRIEEVIRKAQFAAVGASSAAAESAASAEREVLEAKQTREEKQQQQQQQQQRTQKSPVSNTGELFVKTDVSTKGKPAMMDVTTPTTNTTGTSKKKKQELRTWLINNKPAGQRDVSNMTVSDVSNFLRSIDLHLLAQEVEKNDLDGEMLSVIEKKDLDELQLGSGIHRYKFMQVLKRYRESTNSGVPSDESDSNVSMTNEQYSRSLPNSPTNSSIIRTTTPPASAPTSPESGARERSFSSAGRRRSQSGSNILASIDEGKSTDDDELMGPLVSEAFEKMRVEVPMKKVESYTVMADPKVDMNGLERSASAPGHLRRNTPEDLHSTPIRTHPSESTNVKPKRPSALNITESHRNSLIDTEMPKTPVTSALYDVFDSPSPDLDLGKALSSMREGKEEEDDSHVIVLE